MRGTSSSSWTLFDPTITVASIWFMAVSLSGLYLTAEVAPSFDNLQRWLYSEYLVRDLHRLLRSGTQPLVRPMGVRRRPEKEKGRLAEELVSGHPSLDTASRQRDELRPVVLALLRVDGRRRRGRLCASPQRADMEEADEEPGRS